MFCVKCGKQVNDNIKYCPHCGAAQTAEPTVERQLPQSGEQVLSQKENFVKNKKMTKGKIVSVVILIIEALLICGTFVFFNIYNGENDSGNDRKRSRYSLDEANENAELAYGAVEEFINNTYRPQDYAAHGYFLDAFSPDGKGELSEWLSEVIDDGYVRVLLHHTEDYDDLIYTVQWCEDESGDGIVGQYPVPIEKDSAERVVFGTQFDPVSAAADQDKFSVYFEDYFYFKYDDNGDIIITGYKGEEQEVYIPGYHNGARVSKIGDEAFARDHHITKVVIPPEVKEIGNSAFFTGLSSTKHLESVEFSGDGLVSIGDCAFYCCYELKSIKIPKSVETIGDSAFGHCGSLKEVEIPRNVKEIERFAFSPSGLEKVKISDNVEKIDSYAFARCYDLKEVEYGKWYRLIFDPTIFLNCRIFIEYIAKVIAIGIFVITIIIILIVRRHKKRKLLKAQRSITQAKTMANDN